MSTQSTKDVLTNLAQLLKLLFLEMPIQDIQENRVSCLQIPCSYVERILDRYESQLNHQECGHMVEAVNDYVCVRDELRMRVSRRKYINVFDLLTELVESVLIKQNDVVLCRYTDLLSWQELVEGIGSELPVTAKYVTRDMANGLLERKFYAWDYQIGQNNEQLNAILRSGISDHHMHLWGAAPYFEVTWVNLMNHVTNSTYAKRLRQLDYENSLRVRTEEEQLFRIGQVGTDGAFPYDFMPTEDSTLVIQHLKAAVIRIYLSMRLCGAINEDDIQDEIEEKKRRQIRRQIRKAERMAALENNAQESSPSEPKSDKTMDEAENDSKSSTEGGKEQEADDEDYTDFNLIWELPKLLRDPRRLVMLTDDIQAQISWAQEFSNREVHDYALNLFRQEHVYGTDDHRFFSGERWFNYSMLTDIYSTHSKLTAKEKNLYFLYLLIKNNIRRELLQVNDKVGFHNFQQFERRKWYFTADPVSQYQMAKFAVRDRLLSCSYIREMEVRISPCRTADKNREMILWLERAVLGERVLTNWGAELHEEITRLNANGKNDDGNWVASKEQQIKEIEDLEKLQKRYYYVFHFPKRPDKGLTDLLSVDMEEYWKKGHDLEYRHYAYRKELEQYTMAILEFRRRYPVLADRVRGIDACSQEIGCRPENFASIFRMLSNDVKWRNDYGEKKRITQLRKTYHVGEDFLDITDGLRAIDEAVKFLNLDCGDRIGHATALGINVQDWYTSKRNQINLPIQDYLDNVVWLYHAIQRYNIPKMELLLDFLQEEFDNCFRTVYLNHIKEANTKEIMQTAKAYYKERQRFSNYQVHTCVFNIENYYQSWKLRGDHPELYRVTIHSP